MTETYTNATRARARRWSRARAAHLGVTLDARFDGGWYEIVATAPVGSMFAGRDVHDIIIANAGPQVDGLWERLADDLRECDTYGGLEPCSEGDTCECCHPEDDDDHQQ